jgi:hypothetical protein
LTGIKRSSTQVQTFLKKLQMRCRKIVMIPAKADPDQQAKYLEQTLEPRLNEALNGQRVVFFVDAAHFVLAPFLGFLWSVTRLFIRQGNRITMQDAAMPAVFPSSRCPIQLVFVWR